MLTLKESSTVTLGDPIFVTLFKTCDYSYGFGVLGNGRDSRFQLSCGIPYAILSKGIHLHPYRQITFHPGQCNVMSGH